LFAGRSDLAARSFAGRRRSSGRARPAVLLDWRHERQQDQPCQGGRRRPAAAREAPQTARGAHPCRLGGTCLHGQRRDRGASGHRGPDCGRPAPDAPLARGGTADRRLRRADGAEGAGQRIRTAFRRRGPRPRDRLSELHGDSGASRLSLRPRTGGV
jgi:hypothetical protein